MRGICDVHGEVDSASWKVSADGRRLCGECFKPRRTGAAFLTQKSQRVIKDQEQNEEGLIQPFEGGKPNPSFVKSYPCMAPHYYNQKELKKMGAEKMKSTKHKPLKDPNRKPPKNAVFS